ncbi:Arginase, catabolizes arginine to ornithine and urea [Tulasnella sp. 419]|nr:Arginase, catabolizes arginine to ornithine and urea [Tulasnella sp. 418]KAG8964606.1 Arginase, catabolizes arginine to ornithine and urea [Tulasnella sp. 419]
METPNRFISNPPTVAPRAGVDKGPVTLVEAGLVEQISGLGWAVEFGGHHQFEDISAENDPPMGVVKRPKLVSRVTEEIAKVVGAHVKAGKLPLTLGGDHSLAMGTVSGTLSVHPDACLIWIDAHADINTIASTASGNLHGMPVSFLLGLNDAQSIQALKAPGNTDEAAPFSWITPLLDPSRLAFIGLRDVDPGEKRILKENKIKAFSMHDVDKHGISKVVEMALDAINPGRDRPIHLSFDVDALDPSVAPSTGTPVRGGLTFREGHYICEAIHETGLLVALDIMEVNPSLEDPVAVMQTVAVGCSLARCALGETLL